MKIIKIFALLLFITFTFISSSAQVRDSRIHERGMLHETIYNDGSIGRAWQYGAGGEKINTPCFEWPPRSNTVINGIEYSGHHNAVGAGMAPRR